MSNKSFVLCSFYRFYKLENKSDVKLILETFLYNKKVRGTILLADEGINGSISASEADIDDILKFIKKKLNIRKLSVKFNRSNFLPFNKLKIRIKKEIVSLGRGKIDVNKFTGQYVHPLKWDKLIERKKIKVIDTRNKYEFNIGNFKNAINPKTNSFREFPDRLKSLGIKEDDYLALYCTGGIRCEKASAYLKLNGFKNVLQLEGGIINYLNYRQNDKKKSHWNGECFVFDNRVTINKNLQIGNYVQCHGCRHPLTKKEIKLKSYKKGVSCKYCFKSRNLKQKRRSEMRQIQINNAEKNNSPHPFKKVFAN